MMEKKVRFHLPGLRYNYPLNMFWVSLLQTHPDFFREGVEIGSFFGTFPYSLWNGGRLIGDDQCDAGFVKAVVKNANNAGIPIRYTFTNPLLEEKDIHDPFCNFCMEVGDNGMNEVMIMSPVLEKYIREKYPSYKHNSSTCKEIRDVDTLNKELEGDYKYVVLDYNLNNRWDLLEKVKQKERLEVLVNPICIPNCPRRGEHYEHVGRNQRTILENRSLPPEKRKKVEPWHCEYGDHNCLHTIMKYPTFISVEAIWENYVPNGINNFKIEGRTAYLFSLIDTYCYYMLKPECIGEARLMLIKNLEQAGIFTIHKPRPAKWP